MCLTLLKKHRFHWGLTVAYFGECYIAICCFRDRQRLMLGVLTAMGEAVMLPSPSVLQ